MRKFFQPNSYFTKSSSILVKFSDNIKKHFEIKFLKFSSDYDDFLLNTIFSQSQNIGVDYVTSIIASVEA